MKQNLVFLAGILASVSLLSAAGVADAILAGCASATSPETAKQTDCSTLCGAGNQTNCTPTTSQSNFQSNFYYLCPAKSTGDPKLTTMATALKVLGQINAALNPPVGSTFLTQSVNTQTVIDAINQVTGDFPSIRTVNPCQKNTLDSLVTALVTALDNKQVTSLDTSCVQATQNLLGNIKICLCSSQEKNAAAQILKQWPDLKSCFRDTISSTRD